jgi:imidazolonepropionase-like amidohydrolase
MAVPPDSVRLARLSRRRFLVHASAVGLIMPLAAPSPAFAQAPDGKPIAFTNIAVFDGHAGVLRRGLTVIVAGNKIQAVDASGAPPGETMQLIDGGGRVLMPGLIDNHWHSMMAAMSYQELANADIGYINLMAADQAAKTLMRGFTSVRDLGGPCFGLKRAIDAGLVAGPRIWPSGAIISQTSGHADYRPPAEIPDTGNSPFSRADPLKAGVIADGADQVLKRVREQLMLGASQIKLAAGGGVASNYDPIDVAQFTEGEIRAAVEAAANWNTYVTVHAYTPRAIQTAIRAGVLCIDHGQLMDEATAKMLADKGIWFSAQPFLEDEDATPFPKGSDGDLKQRQVAAGTDIAYGLAKKYQLKTAWGSDVIFDPRLAARQGAQLAKMKRWYTPADILKMATGTNAALLALSGPRSPYPGKLGLVEAGAYADLLLVDGDPTTNIDLVADAEKNFKIIMKDGRIHKNTLAGAGSSIAGLGRRNG